MPIVDVEMIESTARNMQTQAISFDGEFERALTQFSTTDGEPDVVGALNFLLGENKLPIEKCREFLAGYVRERFSSGAAEQLKSLLDALDGSGLTDAAFLRDLSDHFWAQGPVACAQPPTLLYLTKQRDVVLLFRAGELVGSEAERAALHEEVAAWAPSTAEEYQFVGLACARLKRWAEAIEAYDHGLAMAPRDLQLWLAVIDCGFLCRDLEIPLRAFKALALRPPTSERDVVQTLEFLRDEVKLPIGKCLEFLTGYLRKRFASGAAEQLKVLLDALDRSGLTDAGVLRDLSDHFWAQGPVACALPPTLLYLGKQRDVVLLFRAGELVGSEAERAALHEEAAAWAASRAEEYQFVGLACARLKRWAEAIEAYDHGLAMAPRDLQLWLAVIDCAILCNDLEIPLRTFKALALRPPTSERDVVQTLEFLRDEVKLPIGKCLEFLTGYLRKRFASGAAEQLKVLLDALDRSGLTDAGFLRDLSDYFWAQGPVACAQPPTLLYLRKQRDVVLLFRAGELVGSETERAMLHEEAAAWMASTAEEYQFVGLACARLKRWAEAVEAYDHGLAMAPRDLQLWLAVVDCAIRCKDFQVLVDTLERYDPAFETFGTYLKYVAPHNLVYLIDQARTSETKRLAEVMSDGLISQFYIDNDRRHLESHIRHVVAYGDVELRDRIFDALIDVVGRTPSPTREKELFRLEMRKVFSVPTVFPDSIDDRAVLTEFIENCKALTKRAIQLDEPVVDLDEWTSPWTALFFRAVPDLYSASISSMYELCAKVWPQLAIEAPHIAKWADRNDRAKIRIGFIALDIFPMISGLMAKLDSERFERVYFHLRIASSQPVSATGQDWIARADKIVKIPINDAIAARRAIADEELDIVVTATPAASIIYAMLGRLAPLQMAIADPNWCDGFENHDYYITWRKAEPDDYHEYYNSSVALMEHPPYWIEPMNMPAGLTMPVEDVGLDLPQDKRIYLCPANPAKLHPRVDGIFLRLLERDPEGVLVLLRMDWQLAGNIYRRMRHTLGRYFDRVLFLPTLKPNHAHALMQRVDCVLDGYPLGGMSSSFEAVLLGIPTINFPEEAPFGKWMVAILDYVGVEGLNARSADEFAELAFRFATDRSRREQKGLELLSKRHQLVQSENAATEFQAFLLAAVERRSRGLAPVDWLDHAWYSRAKAEVAARPAASR